MKASWRPFGDQLGMAPAPGSVSGRMPEPSASTTMMVPASLA
jgi:hypothetical protein